MKVEIYRDADYREILELQRRRFAEMVDRRRRGLPVEEEWLMAVEHRPVYTLGRHGQPSNLLHPDFLQSHGIDLVEIERGGDITYHGPGQVVVYPLIDLASRNLGVKAYVNLLEEAVIRTVAEWGIRATRLPDAPGVWIAGDPSSALSGVRKICALGIKCSRFVAMHGVALNVTTDLTYFSAINPCGFTDRPATSLQQEFTPSLQPEVAPFLQKEFIPSLQREVAPSLQQELAPSLQREVAPSSPPVGAGKAGVTVQGSSAEPFPPGLCPEAELDGQKIGAPSPTWESVAPRLIYHLRSLLG